MNFQCMSKNGILEAHLDACKIHLSQYSVGKQALMTTTFEKNPPFSLIKYILCSQVNNTVSN